MTWAIAVHGGAGDIDDAREGAVRAGCEAAARAGADILAAGGSALDAACAAVRVLEDNPEFNAGCGAVLTRAGTVELDACAMDGDLATGACGAVTGVRNPIELARAILDDGEHVLLVGAGALAFARERGVAEVAPDYHVTERQLDRLARRAAPSPGTVGAVARDAQGRVAAATSTGGIAGKRPGRVGDSPLPGAGTYAAAGAGAASATGHGEAIIKAVMARGAVDLARQTGAQAAAAAAVADVLARTGAAVGIIVIGAHGAPGVAHATPRMSFAVCAEDLELRSGVTASSSTGTSR